MRQPGDRRPCTGTGGSDPGATRVSVLTFNAGLLTALGSLLEPVPHVERRFEHLPAALRASGADIIVLQEIYDRRHKRLLCSALGDSHPFSSLHEGDSTRWLPGHGLLVLSRWRMRASFAPFALNTWEESLGGGRGAILAHIRSQECDLALLNVHATAGGLFLHPESPSANELRRTQLEHLLSYAKDRQCALVVGDFNCGPEVSPANYREILGAGWLDCYAHLNPGRSEPTWDPGNPLNRDGPHRSSPPQRIDHVFLRRTDYENCAIRPVSTCVTFREPLVALPDGETVTLSDHNGLLVEMRLGNALARGRPATATECA